MDPIETKNLTKNERIALELRLPENRIQAHQIFFRHRHSDETPAFHEEIITDFWSPIEQLLEMAFREGAKTTLAEEVVTLGAYFSLFRNCVIISASRDLAVERLKAVKFELENNTILHGLYGDLRGPVWNEDRVELNNNVCIQARGREQAMRGTKYLQWRPDLCLIDDAEEDEHVKDPKARQATMAWLYGKVLPALDKHNKRVRVLATPLDNDAMPMRLLKEKNWVSKVYPIEYLTADGERRSMWSSRYPLAWIDEKKAEMERLGLGTEYQREYMCKAEDPKNKIFTADMFVVRPRVRTYQAVHLMYDPARSVKRTSASTGWVAFSFAGPKIIVWDGGAEQFLPSDLVDHIFAMDEEYHPVEIGVEKVGLEEFLAQPLRIEQQKRNVLLPLHLMDAPKGKLSFIEALQPLFNAKEIEFAKDLPILQSQFLSYPSGRIDGPNALAFALRMRPGDVVFPGFGPQHVVESLPVARDRSFILATHATATHTVGVLLQVVNGGLCIHADFAREGVPGQELNGILKDARLAVASLGALSFGLDLFCPPVHFADYDTLGLRAAARAIPAELSQGSRPEVGRDVVRTLLRETSSRGDPLLRIQLGVRTRWTANAFASGCAYPIGRDGATSGTPRDNVYAVIADAVCSVAGIIDNPFLADGGSPRNYAYTAAGGRYLSALPGAEPERETKLASAPRGIDAQGNPIW